MAKTVTLDLWKVTKIFINTAINLKKKLHKVRLPYFCVEADIGSHNRKIGEEEVSCSVNFFF